VLSRIVLGTYPTRVEHNEALGLWIKRDDLTSSLYGGNKVRKLELLLGAARDAGRSRILTLGAVGSHQVVATAVYGKREGFTVDAVLVAQPASPHAELNLRVALAHGIDATACPAWSLAPAYVAAQWRSDTYYVPLGGSNALASLGFVDAAHELAAQVRAGELPEPDVVVVALGSGGTAAGLAVGFEQLGMRTEVVGVAVSPPTRMLTHLAKRLAQKTAKAAGLPGAVGVRAANRITVDGGWMGKGYGYPSVEGTSAMEVAGGAGVVLDATYTAKAFACALSLAKATPRTVLYWHTLSTAPLEPLLNCEGAVSISRIPPSLARLLR
jgi:1-aminocyclopropane-1-carboxylate deaminase/D-cysteine desulfhydrase-like pyridoxal-dependent ACC family enzyme